MGSSEVDGLFHQLVRKHFKSSQEGFKGLSINVAVLRKEPPGRGRANQSFQKSLIKLYTLNQN